MWYLKRSEIQFRSMSPLGLFRISAFRGVSSFFLILYHLMAGPISVTLFYLEICESFVTFPEAGVIIDIHHQIYSHLMSISCLLSYRVPYHICCFLFLLTSLAFLPKQHIWQENFCFLCDMSFKKFFIL